MGRGAPDSCARRGMKLPESADDVVAEGGETRQDDARIGAPDAVPCPSCTAIRRQTVTTHDKRHRTRPSPPEGATGRGLRCRSTRPQLSAEGTTAVAI
jgi:hypothetical protein